MAKATSKKKGTAESTSVKFFDKTWAPYLLLTGIWAVIYMLIFDTKLNLGGDNAVYYILGESISSGNGYTDIHNVNAGPANHFPPGYPVVLALFMIFTKSLTFLKVVNGLFFLGASLLSFKIFETILENRKLAFVVASLILLNGNLLEYSTILMSEIPFLFFSTLTVFFFLRSQKNTAFLKDWNFWLMLGLAAFSFHIRTAGIALIGGFALFLLIQKNWAKFAVFSGGFVALSLPWFLRGQSLGGSAYIDQLMLINPYRSEDGTVSIGDLFTRLMYNLERYMSIEIPRSFFPNLEVQYTNYMRALLGEEMPNTYTMESYWLVGILILALMIYGIFRMGKYRSFVALYLLGSAAILLLWPYVWFGTRFIMTLIPFMLLGCISGVYGIIQKVGVKNLNPLLLLLLGFFFISGTKTQMEKKDGEYPPKYADFLRASDYVSKNTPEDAVVLNRKPGLFYLYGRRVTTKYPSTFDFEEMRDHFDNNGVDYVIIDAMGFADEGRYLVPFVQSNPENFGVLQQWTNGPNPTYLLKYTANVGYSGEWQGEDGKVKQRTGQGTYHFTDGRIFTGSWKNGIRDGQGEMSFNNGMKLSATWSNDTISGNSILKDRSDSIVLEGDYTEEEIFNYVNQGIQP